MMKQVFYHCAAQVSKYFFSPTLPIVLARLDDETSILPLCHPSATYIFSPKLPVTVGQLEPLTLGWWDKYSTTLPPKWLMHVLTYISISGGSTWTFELGMMRQVFYHCATQVTNALPVGMAWCELLTLGLLDKCSTTVPPKCLHTFSLLNCQ